MALPARLRIRFECFGVSEPLFVWTVACQGRLQDREKLGKVDAMTNELTRRNFVTGLATGAAAVAALGVAGSAGAEEPAGEEAATEGDASTGAAALAEGSYTSTQHTPYATVDVTCTYSAGALAGVAYEVTSTSSADYFPLFESALGEYCDAIVANGKASGVDAVSGATHCSNAIKEGVNACMLRPSALTSLLP